MNNLTILILQSLLLMICISTTIRAISDVIEHALAFDHKGLVFAFTIPPTLWGLFYTFINY